MIPDSVNSHGPREAVRHEYGGDIMQRSYFFGVNRLARKHYSTSLYPRETSRPKNNLGRGVFAKFAESRAAHPSNPQFYGEGRKFHGREPLHLGGKRYHKPQNDDRYLDLQRKFARRQFEIDMQAKKRSIPARRVFPPSLAERYWLKDPRSFSV